MTDPIIKIEDVSFTYSEAKKTALRCVTLDIARGSFTAVLGHNGSGKSTLAKCCNGILVPQTGRVLVAGMDTADEAKLLDIRRTVGMVFQNPDNQIVASVVEDDVAFAPENLGVPPKEIRQRVDEALKRVGMYEFRLHDRLYRGEHFHEALRRTRGKPGAGPAGDRQRPGPALRRDVPLGSGRSAPRAVGRGLAPAARPQQIREKQ